MKVARKLSWLILVMLVLPIAAHADLTVQIGGTVCSSCHGGFYTLNFAPDPSDSTGKTFVVTLTIATANLDGKYISGVGFGDGKGIASVDLLSTTAGGSWSETLGNINSSGACDGSPGNKVCSQQNNNIAPFQYARADGSTYSWTWLVTFTKPGLNTNLKDIHFSAQYQDKNGSNGWIVSENGTALSEAPLAATLATGLALLAFKLRRRE